MKLLFIGSAGSNDFLADMLFHGFHELLGSDFFHSRPYHYLGLVQSVYQEGKVIYCDGEDDVDVKFPYYPYFKRELREKSPGVYRSCGQKTSMATANCSVSVERA